jgi:hypothetical protein
MSPDPAKKCLRCGYSREGLPVDRACPECGLSHDVEVQYWTGRPYVGLILRQMVWVPIGGLCLGALLMGARGIWAPVTMLVCLAIWLLVILYCLCKPAQTIGTAPDGLVISALPWRARVIPWSEVLWVKPRGKRHQVEVCTRGYGSQILFGYFRDIMDVERFIEAVSARLDAHRYSRGEDSVQV